MRRLRNILPFVILSAWMFTSCEKNTDTETVNVPIGFSNNVTAATRATDIDNSNLTSMGVFACFTHGNFDEAVSTPDFMYNQLVEKKNGTWQYSPVKYWPNNDSDKISFFAYAPHNTTGVTPGSATRKGYPVFAYNASKAEADQVDLLAAVPIMNQNKGNVDFKMQHALTKVVFNVKSNDDTTGKVITAFSVTGAKTGSLTFHAPASDDDKGFGWSYPSTVATETFTATTKSLSVPDKSTPEKTVTLCTFFLLPKDIGNTFSITYTYTGTKGKQTVTLNNQPLPSLDKWLPGAFVSYTIGIDKIVVTATTKSHPSWGDGGQESVDGTIN